MKAFLLDHDDSFTFNLRNWLKPVFSEVSVVNHRDCQKVPTDSKNLIVLSPGPKHPEDYPHILDFLKKLPPEQPVLGVCLGLQMMVMASGGRVDRYAPPLHGKSSVIEVADPAFSDFQNMSVARYHSLICSEFSSSFQLVAVSKDDQKPMWLTHKNKKWIGFQFHPESFLTDTQKPLTQFVAMWSRL